ncbi:Receptor-like protein [Thalictrum thalictroides]|uniref:Receptor-like protein n=1 Tax=Thalictrum thalictroides TaxID=46969 RepID=A0A7J6W0H2_THATH|nr:Receptor-like protein [Thalictrum thalictroides]
MPEISPGLCSLRTLNLNGNKLEGKLSKTLENCTMLEVLDVGNNLLNGIFPCWLEEMPYLRVLVLRANKFNGSIPHPKPDNITFPMLQIIDISSNNFSGKLPSERFLRWKGMMNEEETESNYKHSTIRYRYLLLTRLYYQDAVTVTSKGRQMELEKILTIFTSIDMSNNKFEGQIPEGVGNLTSLYVLNFSGNALTGSIPSSLGNLKQLESLDLSRNMLNGTIPKQLADLTFLSVLNLSFNQLVGTIPQGRQFQTFNENVYEGNIGLCGPPVSQTCINATKLAPSPPKSQKDRFESEFDWRFILTGLGFGAGAAFVVAPLWFWTDGRKWYDKQIDRFLSFMLPSAAFLYDDGRVDTFTDDNLEEEFTEDEELTEHTSNYSDEKDMEGSRPVHGRYCLFCTKVDISTKRVIHNPKCNCHVSPHNSSSIPQ